MRLLEGRGRGRSRAWFFRVFLRSRLAEDLSLGWGTRGVDGSGTFRRRCLGSIGFIGLEFSRYFWVGDEVGLGFYSGGGVGSFRVG